MSDQWEVQGVDISGDDWEVVKERVLRDDCKEQTERLIQQRKGTTGNRSAYTLQTAKDEVEAKEGKELEAKLDAEQKGWSVSSRTAEDARLAGLWMKAKQWYNEQGAKGKSYAEWDKTQPPINNWNECLGL
jgi:hypothetical protein